MTTVTVHPDPSNPHAPQTRTEPSVAPLPVDFNQKPTARDFPIGQGDAFTQGALPGLGAPYPGGSVMPGPVTPTQAVINRDQKTARFQDRRGRVIGIRRMGAGDRMRVMRVLGSEGTENLLYFGHAMLAACVRLFDGEELPMPTSRNEIEALVDRLDDDGLDAIAKAIEGAGWNNQTADASVLAEAKN